MDTDNYVISDNKSVITTIRHIGLNKTVDVLEQKCTTSVSRNVLYCQIDRLAKKHKQLLKNRSRAAGERNLKRWEDEIYVFPVPKNVPAPSVTRTEPFDIAHDSPRVIAAAYKDVAEQ